MHFTSYDYKKIQNWLTQRTVKDSALHALETVTGDEILTVVQDGENYLYELSSLIASIVEVVNVEYVTDEELLEATVAIALLDVEYRERIAEVENEFATAHYLLSLDATTEKLTITFTDSESVDYYYDDVLLSWLYSYTWSGTDGITVDNDNRTVSLNISSADAGYLMQDETGLYTVGLSDLMLTLKKEIAQLLYQVGDNSDEVAALISDDYILVTSDVFKQSTYYTADSLDTSWNAKWSDETQLTGIELLASFSVEDIASAFKNCSSLSIVNLTLLDTAATTDFTDLFNSCSSLTAVDLSTWNTAKVTSLEGTFADCFNIETLDLTNWEVSAVTTMEKMFYECIALTTLDLSTWENSKVTTLEKMFWDCSELTSVDLSGISSGRITSIEGICYDCSSLTSLGDVQWSFTGDETSLEKTFYNCSALTSIPYNTEGVGIPVTSLDKAFYNCTVLTDIAIPLTQLKQASLYQAFYYCKALTEITLAGTAVNPYYGFYYCSSLVTADLSGLTVTNTISSLYAAFAYDTALTTLTFGEWDLDGVESIYSMFYNDSALTSLDLSTWKNTGSITTMRSTFYNCYGLTSLDLSSWDTSNVSNLYQTFYNCYGLTSLDLSNWDTSNVSNLYYTFYKCSKLVTIACPEDGLDFSSVKNAGSTFTSCSALESIYFKNISISFSLSAATNLQEECVAFILNNIATPTDEDQTATFSSSLAVDENSDVITAIANAVDKGWTVVLGGETYD